MLVILDEDRKEENDILNTTGEIKHGICPRILNCIAGVSSCIYDGWQNIYVYVIFKVLINVMSATWIVSHFLVIAKHLPAH